MKSNNILLNSRQSKNNLSYYVISFCIVLFCFFTLRTYFLIQSAQNHSIYEIFLSYCLGAAFDFCIIYFLFLLFLGTDTFLNFKIAKKIERGLMIVVLNLILFEICAEIIFWDEFSSRFNFIAVDYLIYTTEVLKNIKESYPVGLIIFGTSSLAIFFEFLIYRFSLKNNIDLSKKKSFISCGILGSVFFLSINQSYVEIIPNVGLKEVSKNGIFSLFHAYFHNSLDYKQFYETVDDTKAFDVVQNLLNQDGKLDGDFISIKRNIVPPQSSLTNIPNVVLVLMESMSARYMESYGNTEKLTPNLDQLAQEGLFFDHIYATGTRTVRGIEATVLSIPPTPGQSIVRRPNNELLYNISNFFHKDTYTNEFIYGGFGYFDNMSNFFEKNGFGVFDRTDFPSSEIVFSNAWGVSDEDLFKQALKREDELYYSKKKFFHYILNTSNHRPFTYPEGRIDIPSKTNREGGVKYSDYAIGKYIEEAKTKPWFKNTIFIFIADHNASVAGNVDVKVSDYLIPFIIYAPEMIKPKKVSVIGSQIDLIPTLLGILGKPYQSNFFGHDLLTEDVSQRAFISTYQKLGLIKDQTLTLLEPNRIVHQFKIENNETGSLLESPKNDLIEEAIAYYQTASFLFKNGGMKNQNAAQ